MRTSIFILRIAIIAILLNMVAACGDSSKREIKAGKYGMMSSETPQYSAIVFMLSLYENKDLTETLSLTDERFARTLKSYHTNKSVQRHVINLRLNDVSVEPVSGGFAPITKFRKKATVDLKITGNFDGDKIVDLKTVSMIKVDGEWRITGVSNTVP